VLPADGIALGCDPWMPPRRVRSPSISRQRVRRGRGHATLPPRKPRRLLPCRRRPSPHRCAVERTATLALSMCGSYAFSHASPQSSARARSTVIRSGGIGVLCETDEGAGAEAYGGRNCLTPSPRRALMLGKIDGFRTRLGWHGVSHTPIASVRWQNNLRASTTSH